MAKRNLEYLQGSIPNGKKAKKAAKKAAKKKASESWFGETKKRTIIDDTTDALHNAEDAVLHAASAAQKSIHDTQV